MGIHLWSSSTNALSSNIITTSGSFGYGIYLWSISNSNTLSNNTITTSGTSSYGIYLESNTNNNSFSGMNIRTNNTGNAFYIYDTNHNFTISNSILNSSKAGVQELYVRGAVKGGTWNFTNVTRANGNPINISWTAGGNGTLNMMWYLDVNVSDASSNPLQNANVSAWNNNSVLQFSVNTTTTGFIPTQTLLEYTNVNNTLITHYSNYTVNTTKTLYTTDSQSVNMSTNRQLDVVLSLSNTAPNTPSVSINSTDLSNKTAQDLNCFATITDDDNNSMNVTVQWYKNNTLNLTLYYNSSYANGTAFNAVLDDANTTKNDSWHCGMRAYDGTAYSAWANSSNLTIVNTAPTITLVSPPNNNLTTNRTPTFNWTGSDDDNDVLQYEINITCWDSTGIFSTGSVYNGTLGTATNYTPLSYLKCLSDNNQYYNWTARVYDGSVYSSWAVPWNISIQSLITISLPNPAVSFGGMNLSQSDNTTDDSPAPLVLSNDGNAEVNISINASDLWSSIINPSSYFQYKIRNTSAGCFVVSGTQTTWANVPDVTANAIVINRLNFTSGYQTGCSNTSVDILVSVPSTEPPGNKSSAITFTSSLAEPKLS